MLYLVAALARARAVALMPMLAALLILASMSAVQAREYAGIVIDARTGKTLYAHKADKRLYPASLTKMMTLYMIFDALDAGKVTLKTRVPFSKYASGRPPSKIGVAPGRSISMEQAIYALTTKSANDVATAVAEKLGGTESGFARMMTRKAQRLGMRSTTFRNASGLTQSGQKTTARDMARLGIALREHHPRRYKYFSTRSWRFGKARYGNHNKLLGRVRGVDGIKTGYTRASGYNLVSSVKSNGRSIVAVVIGGRTGASRNAQMQKLIAQYLPKASRRGRGNLVARAGGSEAIVAGLPAKGPSVRSKPGAYASVAPSVVARAPEPTPAPADPGVDRSIVTASIPEPTAPAPVATQANRTGWIIQVAATPTLDGAASMHAKARGKARGRLDGREAFVETIRKDGQTMHRVRFGGFAGKSQAWAACKALKRARMGCYALDAG